MLNCLVSQILTLNGMLHLPLTDTMNRSMEKNLRFVRDIMEADLMLVLVVSCIDWALIFHGLVIGVSNEQ